MMIKLSGDAIGGTPVGVGDIEPGTFFEYGGEVFLAMPIIQEVIIPMSYPNLHLATGDIVVMDDDVVVRPVILDSAAFRYA